MRIGIAAAAIAMAAIVEPGSAQAEDPTEKKLCLILSASKLPTMPGVTIVSAEYTSTQSIRQAAIEMIANSGSGFQWVKSLDSSYDIFTSDELANLNNWGIPSAIPGMKSIIAKALERRLRAVSTAEITIKAGPIEGTYGFACGMIDGRALVVMTGLVR